MPPSIRCLVCNAELSEEYARDPMHMCPTCRPKGQEFPVSVGAGFSATGGPPKQWLEFGHTGRQVLNAGNRQLAEQWAEVQGHEALLTHPTAKTFRDSLGQVRSLRGNSVKVFRARCFEDGEPVPPKIEQLGPPPKPGGGRAIPSGRGNCFISV
jgi:hypothetical protein